MERRLAELRGGAAVSGVAGVLGTVPVSSTHTLMLVASLLDAIVSDFQQFGWQELPDHIAQYFLSEEDSEFDTESDMCSDYDRLDSMLSLVAEERHMGSSRRASKQSAVEVRAEAESRGTCRFGPVSLVLTETKPTGPQAPLQRPCKVRT